MTEILSLTAILDIAIVAFGIYFLFIFVRQSRSYFMIYGLLGISVLVFLSTELDLGLTRKVLSPLLTFFVVIFVIVFQREIRRFFRWLVLSKGSFAKRMAVLENQVVDSISLAVLEMSKKRTGAILVLSGEYPLDDIIEGGFVLDGKITTPLLLSIFDDSTPGHDGAVLIENRRISKFGVHLPLAEEFKGFATMGTRHRASCGVTERTDSLAIVVSEERGTISVAQGGVLRSLPDKKSLDDILYKFFKDEHPSHKSPWEVIVSNNLILKIISIILSVTLWFFFIFQASVVTKDVLVPVEFQKIPEGYKVTKANPAEVMITVSGKNQDIGDVLPKDFRVVVNLKDREPGVSVLDVTKESVTKPTYLEVIDVEPSSVKVELIPSSL